MGRTEPGATDNQIETAELRRDSVQVRIQRWGRQILFYLLTFQVIFDIDYRDIGHDLLLDTGYTEAISQT